MDKKFVSLKSNLRILLARRKMNMSQLSEMAHVSRPTISKIRDEIPARTSLIVLMKLSDPLGVTWYDLIDWEANDATQNE